MKKLVALALTLILALGCMGAFAEETTEIYFLNFKPEIAEVYEEIAAAYEAETGVHVNVVTAAAGTYEQTLRSEIAKADAPTIFQINGRWVCRAGRTTASTCRHRVLQHAFR